MAYILYDPKIGYRVQWAISDSSWGIDSVHQGFAECENGPFIVAYVKSNGDDQAQFSERDEDDQVKTGIYGVIGNCHERVPDALFRYSCGGTYFPIDPMTLFAADCLKGGST